MKFVFIPQGCLPFHAYTLDERPIGGVETGVIRLAEELHHRGQEVVVLSRLENPPLSKPLYLPFRAVHDIDEIDVIIAVREWLPAFMPLEARYRLFWTGDSYDQPHSAGLGDRRVVERLDAFLAVSEWHADTMCQASGFPREKAWVIRNGLHLPYFARPESANPLERRRKRLIYSSTPYRGLVYMPEIFREISQRHPDAQLHVFSGYDVYRADREAFDPQAEAQFKQICRELEQLPGCYLHGNVKQSQLAQEYLRSAVLLYPNRFEETSCITAMEAQASGCVVLSSALGALPETVGDGGVLIAAAPGSAEFIKAFVEEADRLLSDDELFNRLSANGLRRAQDFGWGRVAERLLTELEDHGANIKHAKPQKARSLPQHNPAPPKKRGSNLTPPKKTQRKKPQRNQRRRKR